MDDIITLSPATHEIRDLRLALALAAAGSTTRASALLHLSQPAVSRALLAVEAKLDTRLFERTQGGLVPTGAGQRLLAGAREVLVGLGDLERDVRNPVAPVRLRLVCECYTAYHWLPSVLATLQKSLPEFEVSLELSHTFTPVAGLAAGELDVALLTTAVVPRSLQERPLFADEVVFVVSAAHPLAARKALTRADLREGPLLTSTNTPPAESAWFMKRVFGRTRPRLKFQRLPLTEAILDVTRAGLGIAVLSEWIAGPHLGKGDLVAKRLATGPLRRPWRIAYRREASQAALRLAAILEAAVPHGRLAG